MEYNSKPQSVADALEEAAKVFRERSALYKDNYKQFGHFTQPLLKSVELKTADDFTRMGLVVQVLNKVSRYLQQFQEGGHSDSLTDLAVYAMMLKEVDAEVAAKSKSKR